MLRRLVCECPSQYSALAAACGCPRVRKYALQAYPSLVRNGSSGPSKGTWGILGMAILAKFGIIWPSRSYLGALGPADLY